MPRSDRLFEMIQTLRTAAGPMTAQALAERLEVSKRTVYRDIATLQSRRTPIEGEAGVGYIMRPGYDLPPLNFDAEEITALRVGLAMLTRSGDSALEAAASRIHRKVDALHGPADWLQVSPLGAPRDDPEKGCVSVATVRDAIRQSRKLRLTYRGQGDRDSDRTVRPVAVVYHLECIMVAAWCELRGQFRHFRMDRIYACTVLDQTFSEQAETLRSLWRDQNRWDDPTGRAD